MRPCAGVRGAAFGDRMFDLAWSEIALIVAVAVIVIGPKDLPDAVRGVARMVRKARAMASEFRTHADDLVREANLHEVRDQINEIRNFNIRDTIEKAVDEDGSLRKTMNENPLHDVPAATPAAEGMAVAAEAPAGDATPMPQGPPPAFVPPPPADPAQPPAFIPPGAAAPPAHTS